MYRPVASRPDRVAFAKYITCSRDIKGLEYLRYLLGGRPFELPTSSLHGVVQAIPLVVASLRRARPHTNIEQSTTHSSRITTRFEVYYLEVLSLTLYYVVACLRLLATRQSL